jgi:CheY-like chemotaxis protein
MSQMPIVDGLTSTKMIRSFEKTHPADPTLSEAGGTRRIPILAVSASLVERERYTYIDAGFDGWILKPIDFNRLNTLLTGVVDEETRSKCHYQPGQWERGGFFDQAQRNVSPIGKIPASRRNGTRTSALVDGEQPEKGSITSESSGSSGSTQGTGGTTPVNEPRRPLIHDERLDSSQSDRRESVTPPGKGRVEGVTGHPDA